MTPPVHRQYTIRSAQHRLQTEVAQILGYDVIEGNMSPDPSNPRARRYYWLTTYSTNYYGLDTDGQSYRLTGKQRKSVKPLDQWLTSEQLQELVNTRGNSNTWLVTFGSGPESATVKRLSGLLSMLHTAQLNERHEARGTCEACGALPGDRFAFVLIG